MCPRRRPVPAWPQQAFGDDFGHRAALAVGNAQIALHRATEKVPVLHKERIVQAKAVAQPLDILHGAFLPQHRVDRVADVAEHGKGHQTHDQQDKHGLQDAAEDVADHMAGVPVGVGQDCIGQGRPSRLTPW